MYRAIVAETEGHPRQGGGDALLTLVGGRNRSVVGERKELIGGRKGVVRNRVVCMRNACIPVIVHALHPVSEWLHDCWGGTDLSASVLVQQQLRHP